MRSESLAWPYVSKCCHTARCVPARLGHYGRKSVYTTNDAAGARAPGDRSMRFVSIHFDDRTHEGRGLVALARRTRVDALPDGIYRVYESDLAILCDHKIGFRIVTLEVDP